MTLASTFVASMQQINSWNKSSILIAKQIDRNHKYDKMERDLGFIYFSDGSVAGVRPVSRQAWEQLA